MGMNNLAEHTGGDLSVVEADVVVLGAGAAGVVAAITAARSGAKTLLIDAGPLPGGELISGMAIDGAVKGNGAWVLGGWGREVLDGSEWRGAWERVGGERRG